MLDSVEERTDERAWTGGLAALGEHGAEGVLSLLRPSARAVAASGMLPAINPTGLRTRMARIGRSIKKYDVVTASARAAILTSVSNAPSMPTRSDVMITQIGQCHR